MVQGVLPRRVSLHRFTDFSTFTSAASVLLLCLLLLATSATAQVVPDGETGRKEYWIKNHSLLAEKDKRTLFAHEVFDKVLASADKRPGPLPELFVLDEAGFPWARSLADGTILLSRGAIDICFRGVSEGQGKARLAFVLGHELSHQVNGDFWHFFFYQGTRTDKISDPYARAQLAKIRKIAQKSDYVATKELKADQYGLIYASMAGYDVGRIVNGGDKFFRLWSSATNPMLLEGKIADEDHPSIEQRAMAIALAARRVVAKIKIFDKGVFAYNEGNFAVAKFYFEDFLSVYQSREAYNNLGLVYYRMAEEENKKLPGPDSGFEVSLSIEKTTRAGKTLGFDNNSMKLYSGMSVKDLFTKYAQTAEGYFLEATRRDHLYAKAYNNLGAVYFLKKEYSSAVGMFDKAITIDPADPFAYNNRAVALLKMGGRFDFNLKPKAKADLEKALKLKPDYVTAKNNLNRL